MGAILVVLTFIIVIIFVLQLKDWFLKYVQQSKAYRNVQSPPNKLPLLGNVLSLPFDPYRNEWNCELMEIFFELPSLFLEFTKKLEACYKESKEGDLYCIWIGTYPMLMFFHLNGLEVLVPF